MRQHLVDRAIQCLKDKSVNVRKYAIQALAKFIRTHPFGMVYGGELRSQPWKDGLAKINEDAEVHFLLNNAVIVRILKSEF